MRMAVLVTQMTTLLFIRGFPSIGITERLDAWLHGFDPIAVDARFRLAGESDGIRKMLDYAGLANSRQEPTVKPVTVCHNPRSCAHVCSLNLISGGYLGDEDEVTRGPRSWSVLGMKLFFGQAAPITAPPYSSVHWKHTYNRHRMRHNSFLMCGEALFDSVCTAEMSSSTVIGFAVKERICDWSKLLGNASARTADLRTDLTPYKERKYMTGSEIHRCTQALRLHLLDMCRMSQKCVDYSIKALLNGRHDFSTILLDSAYEMNLLRNDTKEIARDLMLTGSLSESDIRFVLASMRISDALQTTQKEAFEIAETSLLLQNGEEIDCADLTTMGDLANRLMRLCTVAIFEEEVAHAQVVLRTVAGKRLVATTACIRYLQVDRRTQAALVLSIAERLDELMRQMQEMARAIVFWIEGNKATYGSLSFQSADCFAASSRSVGVEPEYCT